MKFKIGDKVRIIYQDSAWFNFVGEVIGIEPNDYVIAVPDNGTGCGFVHLIFTEDELGPFYTVERFEV